MKKLMSVFGLVLVLGLSSLFADLVNKPVHLTCYRSEEVQKMQPYLRSDDIVSSKGARLQYLLEFTTVDPIKGVMRSSIKGILEQIELCHTFGIPVEAVSYNPEHWGNSRTPQDEIDNLLDSVMTVRAIADAEGAIFTFMTDWVLLEEWGAEIAPWVDVFGIQLQGWQWEEKDVFLQQAEYLSGIVRQGSVDVPIYLQLSVSPPIRKPGKPKIFKFMRLNKVLKQMELVSHLCQGFVPIVHVSKKDRGRDRMFRLFELMRR